MHFKPLPDAAYVRECLDYNPDTGIFYWLERPRAHFSSDRGHWQWNPKYAGNKAGSIRSDGYLLITIDLVTFRAHRIAWLLAHGVDPWPNEVDHIDGDPRNNRLVNLREATRSQQMANTRRRHDNTTGVKGVSFDNQLGRFVAYVGRQRLGLFLTLDQATTARREAAECLQGKFARHD